MSGYKNLSPAEFKQGFQADSNAVVLDVRTPAEVAEGTIEGAKVLDFFDPNFAKHIMELDKDKNYYIYCRSGNRSGQACAFMASNGFGGELVNLVGGMMAWS